MSEKDSELARFASVMTVEEVAEVLRLNSEHVTKLMRERKLPGFKVYGTWRVKKCDIQALMDGTWRRPDDGPTDDDSATA